MGLKELLSVPDGVRHAAAVIAGLDRCFVVGFGRLGPEQAQSLQVLARLCSGTPLKDAVGAAVEALTRNEFVECHFAALAAARAALQGAQYDALRKHAAEALGRTPSGESADEPAVAPPEPVKVWQESTRHWLMEIAIAGFGQLEPQTLAPFAATLEQLQAEPLTTRLAALLTGFRQELLNAMPIAALPALPAFRWADLWTRAMIAALRPPAPAAGKKVSGTLSPLGIDLRHHGYFVSADVYGVLDGSEPRLVRVTLSSYKVDVVRGSEMWQCFGKPAEPLLKAVADLQGLAVNDATLLPTGDLLMDGKVKVKGADASLDAARKWLAPGAAPALPSVAALDRHPVQIAEPILLEGYKPNKEGTALDLGDGVSLRVATERISGTSELQAEHVAGSTMLLGLLRFDGGAWAVQPLAVAGPKGSIFTGMGAAEPPKTGKKKPTLVILKERASRLLRKKA
ncbi:MAG TPA: hypothetical protein VKA46_05015 [Gemmataceae bacterium]|nr:hypothetical protein [Gemmataceae bacterium]